MRAMTSGPSVRRCVVAGCLAICALACMLATLAPDASALQTRPLVSRFGSLSEPHGIAIDQSTGDLYVADTANNRIEKFDPTGKLLLAFGADVGGAGVNTCTSSCAAGTRGSAPGQFTTAKFVAVDNSGGASKGDVYVGDVGDNKVSKFDSSGNLVATWGTGGQLNGSTTTAKTFAPLAGVTVDPSGNLFVAKGEAEPNSNGIFKFSQSGSFTTEFTSVPRVTAPDGLASDGSGNLFKVNGDGSVEKMTSGTVDIGTVTLDPVPVTSPANAIAVDPVSGDLYVATADRRLDHYAFNGSGQVIEPSGPPCTLALHVGCAPTDTTSISFAGSGIAIDHASEDSYVANPSAGEVFQYGPLVTVPDVTTEAPTAVNATAATLNGKVNPDAIPVTSCEFEYVSDDELREALGEDYEELVEHEISPEAIFEVFGTHAACESPDASEIGSGSSFVPVHARVTGLTAGARYHYRLAAANANGPNAGAVVSFVTVTVPRFDSAAVRSLTAHTAELTASINPGSGDTTYRFEYGTSTAYGSRVPIPDADIGAGASDVAVSQRIGGLEENVTYHWRVVATNSAGTTIGVDHTFIYETPSGALPDGRAYEMVTPPQKNGSLIGETGGLGLQPSVAANGSRVIATSLQCFAGAESCNGQHGDGVGSPYSFTRTTSGWAAEALAPPASRFAANTPYTFDASSGLALFSMSTPPFGEEDFYKREADGSFVDVGPITPPEAGPSTPQAGKIAAAVQYQTSDLSHFAWDMGQGSHWGFDATEPNNSSAYEYVGSGNAKPFLVGVSGGKGSTELIDRCETTLGARSQESVPGALSSDGLTAFFTARTPSHGVACPGGSGANAAKPVPANTLYARVENAALTEAHTVTISQRSPLECTTPSCSTSAPADAAFRGASEDGSMAYFTDTQQLTNEASEDSTASDTADSRGCTETTGPNGCNLYLYDFHNAAGHQLVAVSAGDTSGGGPQVQGVMAVSPDGSHVYFVAKGVLAANAGAGGSSAAAGADNLYVYERDAAHPTGRVAFIATLSSADHLEWLQTNDRSNVSPDGRFFVFLSHSDLTPDDTSASGARQVFRYDAQSASLLRISIGDSGYNDNGNRSSATPCGEGACSEDASIALPPIVDDLGGRSDPTMSDDGSYVFFTSPVGLAPGALNDIKLGLDEAGNPVYAQNVYEWHEGRVRLISDGHDVSRNAGSGLGCAGVQIGIPSSVCLIGADTTGANVFFATADQLVPRDTDTELDYYDARVCTASEPCLNESAPPVSHCEGEGCQGAASAPPSPPSSGSASLSGSGNVAPPAVAPPAKAKPKPPTRAQLLAKALKACRAKHDKRKRAACEKQARKRYGTIAKAKKKPAKKSSRRGGR